jgi:hypothetical protein
MSSKSETILLLSLLVCLTSAQTWAQTDRTPDDSKLSFWNSYGAQYPQVDSQLRGIFRLKVPNAQKVRLHLNKDYDMVKDGNGVWSISFGSLEGGSNELKSVHDALVAAGIKNYYYISHGTAHEWQTWQRSLDKFGPLLF